MGYVLSLFLGWRVSLLVITFLGLSLLPTLDFYNKQLFYQGEKLNYWSRWANWDSGGYLYIAEHGYIERLTVFFPLFPLLIRGMNSLGLGFFWSGFFVSQISTIGGLFYLFKLVRLDFSDKFSKRVLFIMLIFPTSFYLGTVYTEGLMLFLATNSLYYAQKKRWFLTAILAGLAGVTRLVGIGLILAVIMEYLYHKKEIINIRVFWETTAGRIVVYLLFGIIFLNLISSLVNNLMVRGIISSVLQFLQLGLLFFGSIGCALFIRSLILKLDFKRVFSINFVFLLLSFSPFIFYLLFQYLTFGSPFTFLKSETSWGRIISLPWQGLLFNLKFIISKPLAIGEFSAHVHFQLLIFILTLVCLVISFMKLRTSYTVYFFTALIIPLLSGMLADIARYVLVIFPLFLVLAMIKNEFIQKIGALLSILLLSLLTILYFNSYFFI